MVVQVVGWDMGENDYGRGVALEAGCCYVRTRTDPPDLRVT